MTAKLLLKARSLDDKSIFSVACASKGNGLAKGGSSAMGSGAAVSGLLLVFLALWVVSLVVVSVASAIGLSALLVTAPLLEGLLALDNNFFFRVAYAYGGTLLALKDRLNRRELCFANRFIVALCLSRL